MYNIIITAERIADVVGDEHRDFILEVLCDELSVEFNDKSIEDGMRSYDDEA